MSDAIFIADKTAGLLKNRGQARVRSCGLAQAV
jgi:hypothetical protein